MFSDESDDENEEVDVYRKKYQLIVERCQVIKQDNERLVSRIHQVKKMLRRARRERKAIGDRLNFHGDNWQSLNYVLPLTNPVETIKHPAKSRGSSGDKSSHKKSGGPSGSGPTPAKRQKSKADKNAPKRPANPYFQFCQEQRNTIIEEMTSNGQSDPSKVEVTKHLANKWNTLTQDDKKIYYERYEKSKERYAADMELYTIAKNNAAAAAAAALASSSGILSSAVDNL